jgi:hypothetical protein
MVDNGTLKWPMNGFKVDCYGLCIGDEIKIPAGAFVRNITPHGFTPSGTATYRMEVSVPKYDASWRIYEVFGVPPIETAERVSGKQTGAAKEKKIVVSLTLAEIEQLIRAAEVGEALLVVERCRTVTPEAMFEIEKQEDTLRNARKTLHNSAFKAKRTK